MQTRNFAMAVVLLYLILFTFVGGKNINSAVYTFGNNLNGCLGDGSENDKSTPYHVTTNGNDILYIRGGEEVSFMVKNNSIAFGFGRNSNGQLGDGTTTKQQTPVEATLFGNNIADIFPGRYYTFVLRKDGSAYSIGFNNHGQLGDGSTDSRTTYLPVTTMPNTNVTKIAVKYEHTLILRNKTVWSCGRGEDGRLGLGLGTGSSSPDVTVPTLISGFTNIIDIAMGNDHSLILTEQGVAYSFGRNMNSQLGIGNTDNKDVPTKVLGDNFDVQKLYCGDQTSMLVKKDGKLLLFGKNNQRQIGMGNSLDQSIPVYLSSQNYGVTQVCAGDDHILVLKDNGKVYSFGYNAQGQLGQGSTTNPIYYPTPLVSQNSGIFQISCGRTHSMIIRYTNQCFGKVNENACSGNGLCSSIDECTCAKNYYGNECQFFDCYGKNSTDSNVCSGAGSCSRPDECTCFEGFDGMKCEMALGNSTTSGTTVYAFGANSQGELGISGGGNQNSPVKVTSFNYGIEKIFGGFQSFYMKNNASAFFSSGNNNNGELLISPLVDRNTPGRALFNSKSFDVLHSVAPANQYLVFMSKDKKVYSLGINNVGQLCQGISGNNRVYSPVLIDGSGLAKQVSAYWEHTMVLKNGTVETCGRNENGRLGLGHSTTPITTLQTISNFQDITQISAGADHSMILDSKGDIYCFGFNQHGQLGDGTTTERHVPTKALYIKNIIQISAGRLHSLALDNDGVAYSFGLNDNGQLGRPLENEAFPSQITKGTQVSSVSAGWHHSMILKKDGIAYGFGNNDQGQLGIGSNDYLSFISVPVPLKNIIQLSSFYQATWVIVSNFNCFGKTKDDQSLCSGRGMCIGNDKCSCKTGFSGNNCEITNCFGKLSNDLTVCSGNGNCTDVDVCTCNSPSDGKECEFSNNGILHTLWTCGQNSNFQLGDGTNTPQNNFINATNNIFGIQKLFGGYTGTNYVMSNHSRLYSAGLNTNGQMFDDSETYHKKFSDVQPQKADISYVSAGIRYTMFIRNGSAYGVGLNTYGMLGDGTRIDRQIPTAFKVPDNTKFTRVAANYHHTLALSDGKVYSVGYANYGRLGLGNRDEILTPALVPLSNIVDIAVGGFFSVALENTGKVYTFGQNNFGQLGIGSTIDQYSPVVVGGINNHDIIKISTGDEHVLMMNKFGQVFGFGRNNFGQLGDGTEVNRVFPVPIAIENSKIIDVSSKSTHSLILKSNGVAYSFGRNDAGQLGIGSNTQQKTPQILSKRNIIAISASEKSSLILQANYICYSKSASDSNVCSGNGICIYQNTCSCGEGYFGFECQYTNCFGKNSSDTTVCSGNGNCTDVNVCSCNSGFSGNKCEMEYSIDSQTVVYVTGRNNEGQLGDGSNSRATSFKKLPLENYFVVKVSAGSRTSFLTKNYSNLFGMGENNFHQINYWDSSSNRNVPTALTDINSIDIQQIANGDETTYILKRDKTVHSIGRNDEGQMGIGNNDSPYSSFQPILENNNIVKICAGYDSAVVLKESGVIYTFGKGNSGRLGTGNYNDQNVPQLVNENSIVDIACGSAHVLYVKSDGSLYSFGRNDEKQLGLGNVNNQNSPQTITVTGVSFERVFSAAKFSFAVTFDHKLYGWGRNNEFQLGINGDNNQKDTPVEISFTDRIHKIATGTTHTVILTTTGRIWTFGANDQGQIATGNSIHLHDIYPIMDIGAGFKHTILLQSNFTCQGVLPSNTSICLGRGICVNYNYCSCDSYYGGNNCEYNKCYGYISIDSNVCSTRGDCIAPNNCSCRTGSSGDNCQNYECFGINSKFGSVCSSSGTCVTIDTCQCNLRSFGSNCEITIQTREIFPLFNQVILNKTQLYTLATDLAIEPLLMDYLECRLGNKTTKATVIDSKHIQCELTVNGIEEPLTIWYSGNQTFSLSSNVIKLMYFSKTSISYNSGSSQIGLTSTDNNVIIDIPLNSIPIYHQSRIICSANGSDFETNVNLPNVIGCKINVPLDNIYSIGLKFLYPNQFKIPNITSIFSDQILIQMQQNSLNQNDVVTISMDTKSLISKSLMKHDCSDIIVTFNNQSISRQIQNCNQPTTSISFKVIENIQSSFYQKYSIYYGNEFQNSNNPTITGNQKNLNYTLSKFSNTALSLSTNQISFRSIPSLMINTINPSLSLIGTKNITLNTNIEINNFNLLDFEISDGFSRYSSIRNSNQFYSFIKSNVTQSLDLSIYAIYKITKEKLLISNSSTFYFWDMIPLQDVYPFIDKFNETTKSQSKIIRIQSNETILSDIDVYCQFVFKGLEITSKSTKKTINSIECNLSIDNLSMNTELIHVGLYLNDSNNKIHINKNNLTYVFLKEPITISGLSKTILPINYLMNFTLNFDDLRFNEKVSFQNYSVIMNPEFNNEIILDCIYETNIPKCKLPYFNFTHVPVKINSILKVYSQYNSDSISISIDTVYHKENITIDQEYPYLIDLQSYTFNPISILFNSSKSLNPSNEFYCQHGITKIKAELISNSQFKCTIHSNIYFDFYDISFWINNTNSIGLDGIISKKDSRIEFSKIVYSPNSFDINSMDSIIITRNHTNSTISIPNEHLGNSFELVSIDSLIKYPCSIVNSNIHCQKKITNENTTNDIYFLYFNLFQNNIELTKISSGLLIYKNNTMLSMSPTAALTDSNVNLTVTVDKNTFNRDLSIESEIYCRDNSSHRWIGILISRTQVNCFIPYIDHNSTIANIEVVLSVPSYSSNDIILTQNSIPLTYLSQNDISFGSINQTRFEYTSSYLPVNVSIDIFLPQNLKNNIFCRMSGSTFNHLTYFSNSVGNLHFIICNFTSESPGAKNISLWFKDGNDEFQISKNQLELVFATKEAVNGISPTALNNNKTKTITISTLFSTEINYGSDSEFYCEFGYGSNGEFVIANSAINGKFECTVLFPTTGEAFLNLWLKAKNILKTIIPKSENFKIVDGHIMVPSFGTSDGGKELIIYDYSNPGSFNAKFRDVSLFSKYDFNCTKNGTSSLVCITPKILNNDILPFSSKLLKLTNNENISTPYILYEPRNIAQFNPKVISATTGSYSLNITFDKDTILQEGSLKLVLAEFTLLDTRIDLGNFTTSSQNAITSVDSFVNGIYKMYLAYFNSQSFEFRSMFRISQIVNITYSGVSSIVLKSDKDIFYINTQNNVTIEISQIDKLYLNDVQKESIKCKLDNIILPTIRFGSSQFICSLNSSVSSNQDITMVYENIDAHNGQVLLSSDKIRIVFVEPILIEKISPFATLQNSIKVQLNTSSIFDYDSNYQCVYQSNKFIATKISSNQFECTMNKVFTNQFITNVSLNIVSKGKELELSLSDNSIPFYFLNPIEILSVKPHVLILSSTPKSISKNLTFELKSDLLTSETVYCRFTKNGVISFSKLNYVFNSNLKEVYCPLIETISNKQVQYYDVQLWMTPSLSNQFILSSNNETYLIIPDLLHWKTKRLVNLKDSFMIIDYFIPNGRINYEVKMIGNINGSSITSVNCDYQFGFNPNCSFPISYLDHLDYVPLKLNFTFHISHNYTKLSEFVSIDYLIYYRDLSIQHIKPFLVSHFERLYNPVRVISNVDVQLNRNQFSIFINISSNGITNTIQPLFDISNNEVENGLKKNSHFSFPFNTFSNVNANYDIQLYFQSEFGDALLTPFGNTIFGVSTPSFSPNIGPDSGNYEIFIPFKQPKVNFNGYNITVQTKIDGNYKLIGNCNLNSSILNCSIDPLNLQLPKLFKKLRLDIFINDVRSINLSPYFIFYKGITITHISPSISISKKPNGYFYITTSNFIESFGKFKIKYLMNSEMKQEDCSTFGTNVLICKCPQFSEIGNLTVQISQGGIIYQNTNLKIDVFDSNPITFDNFTPSKISQSSQTSIDIFGSNFFNANNITIKIFDGFIERVSKGQFINSNTIKGFIGPLYDMNIVFPRDLSISISFDGGLTYTSNSKKITIEKSDKIEFSPNLIILNETTNGILLKNYPMNLYYNTSNSNVQHFLEFNSSYSVELKCSMISIEFVCNLTKGLLEEGEYKLKMLLTSIKGDESILYLQSAKIHGIQVLISKIQPEILILNKASPISIKGNWNNTLIQSGSFRFTFYSGSSLFATQKSILIVEGIMKDNELTVTVPFDSNSIEAIDMDVEFSFNKLNYQKVNFVRKIKNYVISDIINLDGIENNFLSFADTENGKILGSNFIDTNDIKIVLDLSKKFDLTPYSNVTVVSNTEIRFKFPNISLIGFDFALGYPLRTPFGLSLNGGNDFVYGIINYLDAFPQPVFTSINPKLSPIGDRNITIFGLKLELVKNCSIYDGITNDLVFEQSPVLYDTESNLIICFIPQSVQKNKLSIRLKNKEGQLNDVSKELNFYSPPTLTQSIPAGGASTAGYSVSIFGRNISQPIETEINCKFGNIICSKPCQWISSELVICEAQQHPPSSVPLSITYNKVDYHTLENQTFTFTTCESGSTAENYQQSCFLCPPGSYKPIGGLFDCIKCEVDTYSSFAGSLSCDKCQDNTTTNGIIGATSPEQCVCKPGYFKNYDNDKTSNSHQKCISCPPGSYCPEYNMTVPYAKPGFWRSKSDFVTYYSCLPFDSCGGIGAENCTTGYAGPRCGFCDKGYYRFRKNSEIYSDSDEEESIDENKPKKSKAKGILMKILLFIKKTTLSILRNTFMKDSLTEHLNMFGNFDVPWDVEYEYNAFNFRTDSESPEDGYSHMNQIFGDLLSWKRLKKNLFSFEKKGLKTGKKIVRKYRNYSRRKTKAHGFEDEHSDEVDKEPIIIGEEEVKEFEDQVKAAFKSKSIKKLKTILESDGRTSTSNLRASHRQSEFRGTGSTVKLVGSKNLERKSSTSTIRGKSIYETTNPLVDNETKSSSGIFGDIPRTESIYGNRSTQVDLGSKNENRKSHQKIKETDLDFSTGGDNNLEKPEVSSVKSNSIYERKNKKLAGDLEALKKKSFKKSTIKKKEKDEEKKEEE
eukprot:gene3710-6599_t